ARGGVRGHAEPLGDLDDLVVVRLPDDAALGEPREDAAAGGVVQNHLHLAELGDLARRAAAAVVRGHELLARADAQDGVGRAVEERRAVAQRVLKADARRAAREHQAVEVLELLPGGVVGDDLRLHVEVLQDAPLAVGPLAAVVHDVDANHGEPPRRASIRPPALKASEAGEGEPYIRHAAMKFRNTVSPCSVCSTSGWNCTAKRGCVSCSMACMAQLSLRARRRNPRGTTETSSLCDSHTVLTFGKPARMRPPVSSTRESLALPNSGALAGASVPP